jgi:hypothetical protein
MRRLSKAVKDVQSSIQPLLRSGARTQWRSVLFLVSVSIMLFISLHTSLFLFTDWISFHDESYFSYFEEDLSTCWSDVFFETSSTFSHSLFSGAASLESQWPTSLSYVLCNKVTGSIYMSNSTGANRHSGSNFDAAMENSIRPTTRYVSLLSADMEKGAIKTSSVCSHLAEHPLHFLQAGMCTEYTTLLSDKNMKCLPSFLIIGVMKAGSGELLNWLRLHPHLKAGMPNSKQRELHYISRFANRSSRGYADSTLSMSAMLSYLDQFPLLSELEARSVYMFEKSPDYIPDVSSLRTIKASLPSARLIVLLREPVKRLVSEFIHHCRHGRYAEVVADSVRVHIPAGFVFGYHATAGGAYSAVSRQHEFAKGDIVRVTAERRAYFDASSGQKYSSPADTNHEINADDTASSGDDLSNYIFDISAFPKGSVRRLSSPCTRGHLHRYLFHVHREAVPESSGESWHSVNRSSFRGYRNNNSSHSNNNSNNAHAPSSGSELSSNMSTLERLRLSMYPEVAHGMYFKQLSRLIDMYASLRLSHHT